MNTKHGTLNHSSVKSFLTSGLLRFVFRPILYSKSDWTHHYFLDSFYNTMDGIKNDPVDRNNRVLGQCLINLPIILFGELFFNNQYSSLKKIASSSNNVKDIAECGHITQAFTICLIERLIKNSPDFQRQSNLNVNDIELSFEKYYGKNNRIKYYLDYFREEFEKTINPSKTLISYSLRIAKELIRDDIKYQNIAKDIRMDAELDLALGFHLIDLSSSFKKILISANMRMTATSRA